MFDASLADYAVKQYKRHNIEIKTSHHVEELRKGYPNDDSARKDQAGQVQGRVYVSTPQTLYQVALSLRCSGFPDTGLWTLTMQ